MTMDNLLDEMDNLNSLVALTALSLPVAEGNPIRKGDHLCFDGQQRTVYLGSEEDRWTPKYVGRAIEDPINGQVRVTIECLWRPEDDEE